MWRDQLQVFFAPERVDLVRSARGLKPTDIANITAKCDQEPGRQQWELPLHQLATMLESAQKTEMTVTISNHFIRYIVLPPENEISTPDEVYAYAGFRMREVHAERVNDWILSVSAWSPSSGAICAAISRELMTKLQELALRHKIKLIGIVPYLVSAFDQWHNLFDDKRNYFVLVEAGRFCIAMLNNNIWQNIRNQRILHNVEEELLAALDQEAIFYGHKEIIEEIHLFSPEHPGLSLPANCGWKIVPVELSNILVPTHFPTVSIDRNKADPCAV
ncbi:MAG: hypothetical protein H0V39_03150 [Nitrosomonas sp.]|nr:hypothetical protein [Nitrosomonas sp.]